MSIEEDSNVNAKISRLINHNDHSNSLGKNIESFSSNNANLCGSNKNDIKNVNS